MSEDPAACIADSGKSASRISRQGLEYEVLSREELYAIAKTAGIDSRSGMTKEQLIEALRKH